MSKFGPRGHTLFLVDISSFIFRAFYAVRELRSSKGEPTNAIYGVANMLGRLVDEARPEFLTIAYDSKEPSFRKEMYTDYKANRTAPPDDLVPQFDQIETLVKCMGIHSVRQSGVEADDLIGTLTKRWLDEAPEHRVVIVTGDKDLLQLVSERVLAWDTMKEVVYGEAQVEEKFGVKCDQLRDYLALVGDSSDNIPGVKSIGPKSATELLKTWGTLEGILAAADAEKIPGKKGEVIRAQKQEALLSQELATLKIDVPFTMDLHQMKSPFGEGKVQVGEECLDLLRRLELNQIVTRWGGANAGVARSSSADGAAGGSTVGHSEPASASKKESGWMDLLGEEKPVVPSAGAPVAATPDPHAVTYVLPPVGPDTFRNITTDAAFSAVVDDLKKSTEFGYEIILTNDNPRTGEVIGIALAPNPTYAAYLPISHRGIGGDQLNEAQVFAALKPFFEDPKTRKTGRDLKFSHSVLLEKGIRSAGLGVDVMVVDYVLDPEGRKNFETIAQKHLNYAILSTEAVCGKGKDRLGFDLVPMEQATRCAGESAWISLHLWQAMRPKIESLGLMKVLTDVDMPLVRTLARMERAGINIDVDYLRELRDEFQADLKRIELEIQKYTSGPVNLNSPKQLAQLLFEQLKLPTQGKTKTGFSTDASVLEALAEMHPVPKLILEYREVSKLMGTYVEPLPNLREKDGKIHASFHQTVAATGRLSSSDPNLQNIPVRSERGLRIRRAFIPTPGNALISADYSQIELRLLAQMSQDTDLLRSFQTDEDVHRRTASEIYRVAPESVTSQQRGVAKAINFGLMYGKTAFGLAQELSISRGEAKEMIDLYFKRYAGVKRFLDNLIVDGRERGYVSTLLGRRRDLKDLNAKNPMLRANAERMAMNTPIQGTAADLMKLAMIRLDERLEAGGFRAKLIVQVHDEVLVDCPVDEVDAVKKLTVECMENAFKGEVPLDVPLRVNVESGANWMDL